MNLFSTRLKEILQLRNMSQAELSKQTGIAKSIINEYVSGRYVPKNPNLLKIAHCLNVNEYYLLGVNDEPNFSPASINQMSDWEEKYNKNDVVANETLKAEEFTARDKRDVAIEMNFLMEQLDNYQEALMFDGEPLDENDRELLKTSLENSLKIGKAIAKQKYSKKK